MPSSDYEIDVSDVEYLRHGEKKFLARLYKPRGAGPFPLIVDVHGGGWVKFDRKTDASINEPLAKSGATVVALDIRMPPAGAYPDPVADINYAIRWCKSRATDLGTRPTMIGILGASSGGHQAMLVAMRPKDERYAALPLPGIEVDVDATVRCVILCWPVIDPLARYHYYKNLKESGNPTMDERLAAHHRYFPDEAAMSEGNPALALERSESVETPPILYLQGTHDTSHPKIDTDRFILGYRKAGGQVDMHWFEGMNQDWIRRAPHAPASVEAIDKMIEFVHREIQ